MCEAITAAPFLCLQIMFCADDGLLKGPSKAIIMARPKKNSLPDVIEAVKNNDQASVSVFTRETFGSPGEYLLCGGRDATERDECYTPETVSEDSQNDNFKFKQKETHLIDTVGTRHTPTMGGGQDARSQLENVVKEQLISTVKLEKERLKTLLERTEDHSTKETVSRKSSESPVSEMSHSKETLDTDVVVAISEMSNHSEETTDTDGVVVRGSALQNSPVADRVHKISKSHVKPTETVILPPSLRRLESWDHVSFGSEAPNAPCHNRHTFSAQNRSTQTSFRTPIEARGNQVSPFSSTPDDLREVRLESQIIHNNLEDNRPYVVPDRSTPVGPWTSTKALEQGSAKSPGSQKDLISPPSLLRRAESYETSSHGLPTRHAPSRVSQNNTIQNEHTVLNQSTPIPLKQKNKTRRMEGVQSLEKSLSRASLGGVPDLNQVCPEKRIAQTRNTKINRSIPPSTRTRLTDDSVPSADSVDVMDEWETLEVQWNVVRGRACRGLFNHHRQ